MILKLFEKLNNPIAVTLILAAILGINGFLFYQQRSTPPEANAPEETPTQTSEANGEANGKGSDEPEGSGEAAKDREDEPNDEQAANEQNDESEAPPTKNLRTTSLQTTSLRRSPSRKRSLRRSLETMAMAVRTTIRKTTKTDRPPMKRNPAKRNPARRPPMARIPMARIPMRRIPMRRIPMVRRAGRAPLAGLGEALDGCEGDREDCVRDFVSQVSPESNYIGGRTDLATGGEGDNAEVLYFEDPEMDTCQFERGRHETEGDLDYTVILVGPGSFNDERGEECIPTT